MIPELSEEERLEWESEKYSSRTLSVRVLSSGRVMVCQGALEVVAGFTQAFIEEHPEALYHFLKGLCSRPLEEYRPPRQRLEERTAQITEGLLAGLSLKI